ncbi:MAG: D-alanyl-D-alanine carboxypeptidase [Candidatus Levybacteria bacterium]|nr:D-alanyl-D-alanine carboxypeptidase [Candidatus Levybacteria bacterium]
MKKIVFAFSLIIVSIFLAFLYIALIQKQDKDKTTVVSPVPDFLSIVTNKQVSGISLWFPTLEDIISSTFNRPEITARSAFVFDITTKKALYEKNVKQKLPMASITKIMTATVALENPKKDNKYFVSEKELVGENSMGLESGETLSLEELLYGLILPSGNDAAEVLAANFQGGRAEFIKAMNNKAKSLGLKDTNFTNPSGLEGDGYQYTTAYDLVVITRYALTNFPLFAKVSETFSYNLDANSTHKAYYLENETNLLTSYPGVKGVKTGYTPEAGLCLVTYLDYKGHKIIAVILGSENRRQEMKDLLDFSLKSIGIDPPPHI